MKNFCIEIADVQTVSFKDWGTIDTVECSNGEKIGKPREKITDVAKMIQLVA